MNQTRLERIAKGQAKTLVHTLTLLDDEGYGDSDLSMLRGSIRQWLDHVTPYRPKKVKVYDENNNCIECDEYFYDPHKPDCQYSDECGVCGECGWEVLSESLAIHSKMEVK